MKVFFILDNAYPSNNPSAKRVKCYCKGLLSQSIQVEILTISQKGNPEDAEGIPYKKIGRGHNSSLASKISTFFYNIRELRNYIHASSTSEDIVFLYSDGLITGILPFIIGFKYRYIRELCEIPYYFNTLNAKLHRLFYSSIVFKAYSGVVAISESLEGYAYKHKSKKCKVVRIPILVDFEKYKSLEARNTFSDKIIFHSGSHTEEKDGFYGMLKVVGILKANYNISMQLVCTGQAPQTAKYKCLIEKFGLSSNVTFLGYISDSELLEWQSKSSLFIINKYDSFQNRYCFATKLGEYLASGKLVIATNVGEITNYLTNEKDCLLVDPGLPEIMAKEISKIYNSPAQYEAIAAKGKKVAEECFDCNKATIALADFLKSI